MDGAGAEEEEALEEGVIEEMEHRDAWRADAEREEHISQLADGREGEHALNVVGGEAHRGGEHGGESADQRDRIHRGLALLKEAEEARDEEHARRDHRRRVNQRTHRSRALHRVGQPRMEGELRGLARGAREQPNRRPARHACAKHRRGLQDRRNLERV